MQRIMPLHILSCIEASRHVQAWVALQSIVIWYARPAQKLLQVPSSCGWPRWTAASLAKPTWIVLVAMAAPLTAGLAPFQRNLLQELGWIGPWVLAAAR